MDGEEILRVWIYHYGELDDALKARFLQRSELAVLTRLSTKSVAGALRRQKKLADIVIAAKELEEAHRRTGVRLDAAERYALRATKPAPSRKVAPKQPRRRTRRERTVEWRQFYVHSLDDGEAPANVYLIRNPSLRTLKIGVTAVARMDEFEADGWEVVRVWRFTTGFDAMEVEERVIDRWRNVHHTKPALKRSQLSSGYTETTSDSATICNDAIEFVQQCHDEMALERELAADRLWDDDDGWPASPWEDWVTEHRHDRALSVDEVERMLGRAGSED